MDRLKAMATYVAIVEQGSLSAAAEHLQRSPASVVRTLAELENYLGVRLLNRTTRRLALTDDGQEYLLRCRRILADVEEAEFVLDARRQSPAGRLAITAPVTFGRWHLAPLLNQWLQQHPGMVAELTLLDRVVDLLEEGFDLALRIGHLGDSSLIVMPLGFTRMQVCASPLLLQRVGIPQIPADLVGAPGVLFAPQGHEWPIGDTRVRLQPVLSSNQIDVVLQGAVSGLGFTRLLGYQVREALARGLLQPVLEDYASALIPVQFVYPHNRLLSPRVRQFLDEVGGALRTLLKDQ
ncbi:LysR family transcriptional regulator [Parathalassolituus penaei]|uniref:LysR family transcriptional regulator n=1 Tax=Parathalassolituus penaei TaxID=2997323 RepID=A0A9X3ECT8_9GAMM|nr:LysR family transcriptional regulator [Parathalassolituus penaei]MCY0964785.1 LysR family transcriptional regulator [Parathalassolituus penaei]